MAGVFYSTYLLSELRRRKGRTLLTALGLGVGVGLVVTVTALSNGLDDAQQKVLKPLTGVGTDMSVNRPLKARGSGSQQTFGAGPGAGLSAAEQQQLRKENEDARVNIGALKGGEKIDTDNFLTTSQLSFPQSQVSSIEKVPGVQSVAPALTLSAVHVSGTVPKNGFGFAKRPAGGEHAGGGLMVGPPRGGQRQPINFDQKTVSGVDTSRPALGLVTPSQIATGRYFSSLGPARQAILSVSYAERQKLGVSDTLTLKGKTYRVVGLAKPPLGGQASDIYIPLSQLQALSGREGRINILQVRTDNASDVSAVSNRISQVFPGAKVTTAKDLADRVTGSLSDAKSLSDKLGTALVIVALAAAFLIAALLTLSSINKRTRELGTLKAIGWRQWLVVRQISGESLAQGALGGLLGALIGIGGAALITAFSPTLKATVAQAAQVAPGPGPGPLAFGQGQVVGGSSVVNLDAPVDATLILLAIALALLGGLLAGAIGGIRAARLRPADALRSVE
jgi:ABC-type antimicrobial peptide transport system permease subunit